jgi:hypothetical protein
MPSNERMSLETLMSAGSQISKVFNLRIKTYTGVRIGIQSPQGQVVSNESAYEGCWGAENLTLDSTNSTLESGILKMDLAVDSKALAMGKVKVQPKTELNSSSLGLDSRSPNSSGYRSVFLIKILFLLKSKTK